MPYYQHLNTLFIHIPKTGGSSIGVFLKEKNNGQEALHSRKGNKIIPNQAFQQYSLQHQFYTTLYRYREVLDIDFNPQLKVISIVRNPYHRLISGLLWKKWINRNSKKVIIYQAARAYLANQNLDNHNTPQYIFLVDADGVIYDHIHIFRTETLNRDMREYGFIDYNGRETPNTYWDFYNQDLLDLVNNFYKKDFEYFGYKQVKTLTTQPEIQQRRRETTVRQYSTNPLDIHTINWIGQTEKLTDENESSLKYYTIFGERNSGTRYLASYLDAKIQLPFTNKFGFKHWFIKNHFPRGRANKTTDNECVESLDNSDDTLFVFIVRNPYDWCGAMKDKPYHIREFDDRDTYSFISNKYIAYEYSVPLDHGPTSLLPWYVDEQTNNYFIEEADNLIALRNLKNKHFYALKSKVKHFYLIRLEHLKEDVAEMIKRFNLKTKSAQVSVDFRKPNQYYLDKKSRQFIEEKLDNEIDSIFYLRK